MQGAGHIHYRHEGHVSRPVPEEPHRIQPTLRAVVLPGRVRAVSRVPERVCYERKILRGELTGVEARPCGVARTGHNDSA